MTKKSAEDSPYATGPDQPGKPVGPEHDSSFHVEEWGDDQNTGTDEPAPLAPAEHTSKLKDLK